ncbi:phosphohistidine phosphatase SixA [Motilibacter peucedani]|uniref:Phosphohistidine phosphatase SixA n=1 Tax=Motilibacter peucedani TaxID=598650 RepID=A0A420XP53_9ACTN|nr:phosphoglycerate mutase family protein [Motilibacter peucedani]RKS73981.1 phosphohistidine phosphatase SixA [Motilibacter peucedani]
MLILVRHAHAGDKRLWPFGDVDRPLSARGHQQAEGLAQLLRELPVTSLRTSPYRRCRQTLVPLSAALGTEPEDEPLLAPESDAAALDALLAEPAAQGTLFCTHGEVLSALLERWRDSGAVALPDEPSTTAKGASWIVEETRGTRAAHYLRPLRIVDVRDEDPATLAR